jgi:hypothetical protein
MSLVAGCFLNKVLGSGKTLIAVLLIRHIIEQELEDRAQGKSKRISFFLVCYPRRIKAGAL